MNTQNNTPTIKSINLNNEVDDSSAENDKWRDPFIEEIHQVRARLLTKANGDMHQLIVNAHQTAVSLGFSAQR